jgi:hypothetical protein
MIALGCNVIGCEKLINQPLTSHNDGGNIFFETRKRATN